jgi:hypothetical protein
MNDGITPLFIASEKGHELVVGRLLQQSGIDVNQAMNDGITPLYVASHKGHELVVGRLLQQSGIDVNQATNNGATPLFIASEKGHGLVVNRLMQHIDAYDPSPFFKYLMESNATMIYEKAQNLARFIQDVHEMKIYYTFVRCCDRKGFLVSSDCALLMKQGLEVAAETCTHEDAIVVYKTILQKARKDKMVDNASVHRFENRAEVKRMENAPFIKTMQAAIQSNTKRIDAHTISAAS